MKHGLNDMPSYGDTTYLKSNIGPFGNVPMQTLISVMGYAAGNYGPGSYGMLCSTKQEREEKKRKRKAKQKSQRRNRK
jgi:hypothetical protein